MTFEFETLILSDEENSANDWCRVRGLEMQVVMEKRVRYRKPNVGFLDAPMKLIRIHNMTTEQKNEWQGDGATRLKPEATQMAPARRGKGR